MCVCVCVCVCVCCVLCVCCLSYVLREAILRTNLLFSSTPHELHYITNQRAQYRNSEALWFNGQPLLIFKEMWWGKKTKHNEIIISLYIINLDLYWHFLNIKKCSISSTLKKQYCHIVYHNIIKLKLWWDSISWGLSSSKPLNIKKELDLK